METKDSCTGSRFFRSLQMGGEIAGMRRKKGRVSAYRVSAYPDAARGLTAGLPEPAALFFSERR